MMQHSVEGFREADAKLAALIGGLDPARERAILHEGAALIVDEAKRLAPYKTGQLRGSIRVVDDREGLLLYGRLSQGIAIYVGPVGSIEDGDVYYAKFQEFGTRYMRAQPFMRPAIAARRDEAKGLVLTRLRDEYLRLVQ